MINEYIRYLNKNYKPKTVQRKLASMHVFFEQLVFDEEIEYNPMNKIRYKIQLEKKLPRIITQEQLSVIFGNLRKNDYKFIKRDRAIIELLISTGIRVSELCLLMDEDIRLKDKYMIIYGKNSKERMIYLGADVLKIFEEYYQEFHKSIKNYHCFFINNNYSQITDQSVRNIINKYTGDFHVTPHMFRHTFATMLLEQDVDIAYIQKILGHSSITTTSIYTHVSMNKQKDIMINKNPRNLIK